MHLVFDILQGAGLAAAVGLRPFLPALAAGALARGDLGIDFEGTSFAFLESTGFLLAMVVGVVVTAFLERRVNDALDQPPAWYVAGLVSLGLGALLFAGSLADRGYEWWPGLLGGVACALLAIAARRSLFGRVRTRLDDDARAALPLFAEGAAVLLAVLAVLVPPVSLLALGFLAWLYLGGRRREGGKYAGLRILR